MVPDISGFKGKRVHFIGIGGCSMNGLARIMDSKGYHITGSDRTESNFTRHLKSKGIDVSIGHDPKNVESADLVVYSAAIKDNNVELAHARELNIPTLGRAELLGQLSRGYETVIGVAGCHGKTTITSMLALIFDKADMGATVHVGGETPFLDAGIALGDKSVFLTEACEYRESFLTLSPTIEIINNIDDDHLDYFRDMEHIYSVFEKYVALLPENGALFGCTDDPMVKRLLDTCGKKTIAYGLNEKSGATAENITFDSEGNPVFDYVYSGEKKFTVTLGVPGLHNVINALAAISVAKYLGIGDSKIISALGEYRLAKRRMELYGTVDGVLIYHDYAHHPNEIKATLQAASKFTRGKLYVVFQCNSYSRAITLYDKYAEAFSDADEVIVPDIYPGREVDTGLIHARDLVTAVTKSCPNAIYIPTFDKIREYLETKWQPGDVVLTLGSGSVNVLTQQYLV